MQGITSRTGWGDMILFFYTHLVTLISINPTLSRGKNVDSGRFCNFYANPFFGDLGDVFNHVLDLIIQGIAVLFVLPFCIMIDTLFFTIITSIFLGVLNCVTHCLPRELSVKNINHSVNLINQLFSTEMLFVFVGTLKGISHGCPFSFGGGTPPRDGEGSEEAFYHLCERKANYAHEVGEDQAHYPHPPVPYRGRVN